MIRHTDVLNWIHSHRNAPLTPEQEQWLHKSIQDRLDTRYKSQWQLLQRTGSCPKQQMLNWNLTMSSLKPEALKITSQKQFYNADLLRAIACVVDSMTLTGSGLQYNFRVREYLRDLTRIGAESVQGLAMQANLEGAEDAEGTFVVKIPRKLDDPEMYHEAFVALFGTNFLRDIVPNFAYVFGLMRCSSPALGSSKKVITWCNNIQANTAYVLYENVQPSISFRKLAKTGTLEEFLNGYLQVLYALHQAQRILEFTHNDLHDENVLWREIPGETQMSIPYTTENGKEYLISDRIATLIDFGFSHMIYRDHHYGPIGMEDYGQQENVAHLFYDAYKLLMFMLYDRREVGQRDYRLFEPLIASLIGDADLDTILDEQLETLYSLPELDYGDFNTADLSVLDWAGRVREHFPKETNFFSKSPQGTVVSCETGQCTSKEKIPKLLGLAGHPDPTDVVQYYDLMTQENASDALKRSVKANFDQAGALKRAKGREQILANETQQLLQNFTQVSLPTGMNRVNLIWSPQFFERYQAYAQQIAQLYDNFADLSVLEDAMNEVQPGSFSHGQLLDQVANRLRGESRKLRSDILTLERLDTQNQNQIRKLVNLYPEFSWYKISLPLYVQMLATPV